MISLLTKLKTEALVGLLILAASGILVYSSVKVTQYSPDLSKTYDISVVFNNVSGLSIGSSVRVAGIKVGEIRSIELVEGKAMVNMAIYQKYQLRSDSTAVIKSLGILGDKYIELTLGSDNVAPLQHKEQIVNVRPGADLDSLIDNVSLIIDDVKSITSAVRGAIGGEKGEKKLTNIVDNLEATTFSLRDAIDKTNVKLDSILGNVDSFTADLKGMTKENRQGIKNMVANLDVFTADLKEMSQTNKALINTMLADLGEFSGDLKDTMNNNQEKIDNLLANLEAFSATIAKDTPEITDNLKGLLADNRQNISDSMVNIKSMSGKLDNSMGSLESITGKVDRGEGTIGKLVNDEETVESLNETLEGINNYLTATERLKIDIGFHTEYMPGQDDFKSYLTANIRPVRDHYYILQLVDNPRGKVTKTEEDKTTTTNSGTPTTEKIEKEETDHELQLSLQIAQRYFDTEFRIGLVENKFGLGVDQYFGLQDQFKLRFDVWDFGREDEGAHYKFGVHWRFYNNLFFVAGLDDSLNKQSKYRDYYFGVGLMFNEDNVKPILGSLPIGP